MSDAFQRALGFTLTWEGGYSHHPLDPGGATNFGITQRTYDRWRLRQGLVARDVREIEESEVVSIYRSEYWEPSGAGEVGGALGAVLFDSAVNSGVSRARRWADESGGDWRALIATRLAFLANLDTFATFGRGWARRVAALTRLAAEIEAGDGERLLQVFGEDGSLLLSRAYSGSALVRARGNRVYVRLEEE